MSWSLVVIWILVVYFGYSTVLTVRIMQFVDGRKTCRREYIKTLSRYTSLEYLENFNDDELVKVFKETNPNVRGYLKVAEYKQRQADYIRDIIGNSLAKNMIVILVFIFVGPVIKHTEILS